MKVKITSRYDSTKVLFETEVNKPAGTSQSILLAACLITAIASGANLQGANLQGANLQGANLRGADLRGADLQGANLYGANLRSANLSGANLSSANLRSANLRSANLQGANLSSANLSSANLRSADLSGANLYGANLSGANLRSADLRSANLSGANLYGANLVEVKGLAFQIPQEGDLIVWKKLEGGVLAKLLVHATAKRTASLVGRKCRASKAKVLGLFDADGHELPKSTLGVSKHDHTFTYKAGRVVKPTVAYDPDIRVECTSGIHFFQTREEATAY